ncbi:MAG: hypothetical protein IKA87_04310 [Lentisphaeria bacterium]|nr:hypothetical protein [Lentisphaeria bacterium]
MKKILLTFLAAIFLPFAASAGDFDDKGLISGWKFAPLQTDISLAVQRKLVDETSDTFFSLGLFTLEQKSAILSIAFIANTLQNNYGVQINPFPIGVATDRNYGISFGFENYCKKCYGIQLGLLNHCWAGEKIEKYNEILQICGINIADTLFIGLLNNSDKIQIGLLNSSRKGAIFQLGLVNYNPRSFIPWMPLINFDMGREPQNSGGR